MSAFTWGGECYSNGYSIHQNPYGFNSHDWKKWIQGWVAKANRALSSDETEMFLKAGW